MRSSGGPSVQSSGQTVVLRFESEPQGAEARVPSGQACRTPCALAVPAQSMVIAFSLNGYLPQSVPVTVMLPEDMRTDSEVTTAPTARMAPDPVYAELQLAPPPKRAAPPRKPAAKPVAARRPPPPPPGGGQQPMASQPSPAAPWPAPQR